ncbi:hypothetical protein [Sphingosinicella sp. BN140058]|uniref:hypothetical protein n=1 Tax=Sphingosinicella sp. BN140058 TaxID=1892855 RepID=UPI0010112944|nr:hypothetical protein [Sphingosinicella sp. BN140058]QAY80391.1 hypothetical protein ETR14_27510 [Sphingosinicella sp. BN140058]
MRIVPQEEKMQPSTSSAEVPLWLADIMAAAPDPRSACDQLLFHGTLETFAGPLKASGWEALRWTCDDPCVAQSYCPDVGCTTAWWAPMDYRLDEKLLPDGPINQIIFRELGFDELALDAKRDQTGRLLSWRVLPGHPTWRDASAFMQALGYSTAPEACNWVKTADRGNFIEIQPAHHKEPGRLFILERPRDLRVFDLASTAEGGLSGRQWMQTPIFRSLAASRRWDAIEIADVNDSPELGQFEHRSIGLFAPALLRLRYHTIPIVNFDPWDCWRRLDRSTTPEFDALWASCQVETALAA